MKTPETQSLMDFAFGQTQLTFISKDAVSCWRWRFVSALAGISAGDSTTSDRAISLSNAPIAAARGPKARGLVP